MLKRLLLVAIFVALSSVTSLADDHREAAKELMRVSGTEQIMGQMQLQIESMFLNISADANYTQEQQEVVNSYRARVGKILEEEMIWKKIEEDIVDLYVESFSLDDLNELITFYKTPPGRKMIEKMPEVMLRSAEISRQQMRHIIPRIKTLAQMFRTYFSWT